MTENKKTNWAISTFTTQYGVTIEESASSLTKGLSGTHIEDAGMPGRWS